MARGWVLAAVFLAEALVGCVSQCFGVWKQDGPIPANLSWLNESRYAPLKARIDQSECPFGTKLIGDVTWPEPPSDLRLLVNPLGTFQVAAVVWSFIPYGVALYAVCVFLIIRGTRQLFVLLWLGLYVLLNETVVKHCFHQPRPGTMLQVRNYDGLLVGSCLDSCGMPSSHSGLAFGLMVLIFLDATHRVRYSAAPETVTPVLLRRSGTHDLPARVRRETAVVRGEVKTWMMAASNCWMLPWTQEERYSHVGFVSYIFFWGWLLLPVPVARIVLFDHSVAQVFLGCIEGFSLAFLWWRLVRNLQQMYEYEVGVKCCFGCLTHNFPLQESDYHEDNDFEDGSGSSGCESTGEHSSTTASDS